MNNDRQKKNVIIISLNKDIKEITQLTYSLNYYFYKSFIQNRTKPDVNYYIGKGKLEDIYNFIKNSNKKIDLIVVDGNLKPTQWFNLEKKFHIDVYDRIRLILEIFKQRADKKEAKLQVRLAELNYEKPFVRELIHRARNGEHPGFMAGGEYQVDDYFEMIKKQMKKIKNDLKKIEIKRKIQRRNRRFSGFYVLSLAGYTNAGKSSILNLLSSEKIKVGKKLFSTLSTTIRKIRNNKIPVLVIDTVGFIEKLPSWMVNSFHSTLEEIEVSDIVLLVIDISDNLEIIKRKLNTSYNELINIGVKSKILIILNKIDLISNENLNDKINYLKKFKITKDKKIIAISVKNNLNISNLLKEIYNSLPNIVSFNLSLPNNKKNQKIINWIYNKAFISKINYDNYIELKIECNDIIKDIILSKINK